MSESLDPLTVSFKGHCVQLFHSNSVFVQSSSDGSQADAFHILEYQVVLYNSGLNFSEFYCIVSNDHPTMACSWSSLSCFLLLQEQVVVSFRGTKYIKIHICICICWGPAILLSYLLLHIRNIFFGFSHCDV